MEGGAYGAGKASSSGFDAAGVLRKPQVILRAVAWLFSIIVFGCIANKGWISLPGNPYHICFYNADGNACNFGIAVGVFAFLACIGFLVVDVMFDNLSNVQMRKYAVIADLAFSGLWTFMWFVCFCYLTDALRRASIPYGIGQARAAAAFSFFSIIPWAGLTVLAFMRYRQGSQAAFSQNYEPDPSVPPPASQISGGDSYQQPPFGEKTEVPDSQFQSPTY
ncbi:synaptogyrin-3-like [Acanthaster planci]|uniref:Synaptogyrin n=1 Tax=Acanthaster planci TaxID=133434 RepID=A0A8B7ZBR7_ACAPL|nr:synaptogyrin-3-like [Acanthaster planci]